MLPGGTPLYNTYLVPVVSLSIPIVTLPSYKGLEGAGRGVGLGATRWYPLYNTYLVPVASLSIPIVTLPSYKGIEGAGRGVGLGATWWYPPFIIPI